MSADCRDERNFVDKHNVNAESNIFVVFQDIFRHDQIIDHHWFRLSPGGFPFQSMDVFSIIFSARVTSLAVTGQFKMRFLEMIFLKSLADGYPTFA